MSTASEQRQAVADLASLADRDLTPVWAADMSAPEVRDALMDLLPAIGAEYGSASAALAADWYEDQRDDAAARGAFAPILAPEPETERWRALARWGTSPLFAAEPDARTAQALVAGGLQRTIADQHRITVVESSIADPAASGWRRVGVGGSCGFCRMLIDRGRVYTEAGVTFRSHDHCNCAAAPSFDSKVVKVSREPYRQSRRNRSDATKRADNARARAYIAEHY